MENLRQYIEAEVLSADPIGLVNLLYRGAIESTGLARRHLAEGNIAERSRHVSRAWEIVRELSQSLDHSQGGEVARSLADLYAYIQDRLLEANSQQAEAPLAEVQALLATLAEAWQQLQTASRSVPVAAFGSTYVPLNCSV